MQVLALEPNEQVIRECTAIFVRSWLFRAAGRLYLTSQRLVFVVSEAAGLSLTEANRLGYPQWIRLEVPRDNFVSVALGKARKKEPALLVESSDGFTYKLLTDANEEWLAELRSMISNDRAAMEQLLEQLKPKTLKSPYR